MAKIKTFKNRVKEEEKLWLMEPEEFKSFLKEHEEDENLKELIKEYFRMDAEIYAGFSRNSMKFNNGAISEESAALNTMAYVRMGRELAEIQSKIIEVYVKNLP